MPSVLRALSTAALAVGQTTLTVTNNGTYLVTVTLDSVPVKLLVDMQTTGVWVKCSAIEGSSCADGITTSTTGYSKQRLERYDKNVPRKTKRFKEVTIAGQVFNGFDGYVVYDSIPEADPSIQGILGLRRVSRDYDYASMYLDNQVTSVALQLDTTSTDSKLSLDSIDQSLLTKRGMTTVVSGVSDMKCFRVPLANGTTECTYTMGSVTYDPALPFLGLYSTVLDTFERRFLYTCTPLGRSYQVTGYMCDANVKLPRLTMQIGSWEFFLDPSEYTVPIQGSSQVQVLTGDYPYIYSGWVLGSPFLRKYAFVYRTSGTHALYCSENTTCNKVLSKPSPTAYSPYYGGGYSGGGGGGGNKGSSPSIGIDVEAKRKRKKTYLTVGLSLGGVAILAICGCMCKCCKSDETNDENADDAKTKDNASVQVAVAVGLSVPEDNSDSDEGRKPKEKKSRSTEGNDETSKAKSKQKLHDSSSSSDDSSYDSDSSEERRRERRRRRRRRRERRHERELRRQAMESTSETTGTTAASVDDDNQEIPYVVAASPKHKI